VIANLLAKLFGSREPPSPAQTWIAQRHLASPEEVVHAHFTAMGQHDLNWILATLTPERARLYGGSLSVDKRRQSIVSVKILSIEPAKEKVPLPSEIRQYRSLEVYRVRFEMTLVPQEQRRDPSLREGEDWAYYIVVTESRGKPWLIADWGK
jgi:hypothetical protein